MQKVNTWPPATQKLWWYILRTAQSQFDAARMAQQETARICFHLRAIDSARAAWLIGKLFDEPEADHVDFPSQEKLHAWVQATLDNAGPTPAVTIRFR